MSRYSPYNYLDVGVADGLATVTLNRPERDNAFDEADHRELASIANDLAADDDVRAVLVIAAGKVFSAGGMPDFIERLINDQKLREDSHREIRQEIHSLVELEKPVVTAVTGPAHGAALALAMLSDIIIVERHVRFRDPHVLLGLAAGDNSVLTWPAAMGVIKAKRYLLTGDSLTADEAERLGLVTEVVDEGCGIDRARTYAERFAAGPFDAIRFTKRALNQWLRLNLPAFDESLSLEMLTLTSGLASEALRRLREGEPSLLPRDHKPGLEGDRQK
jgi:enoyl-CoA hydratase